MQLPLVVAVQARSLHVCMRGFVASSLTKTRLESKSATSATGALNMLLVSFRMDTTSAAVQRTHTHACMQG